MTTTRSATKTPVRTLDARVARWLKPRLLRQLSTLEGGVLIVEEAGRTHRLGQGGPLTVRLRIHHDRVWRRIALGGSVAAGETYMDGDWHCDDLVALIRLLARNLEHVNERLEKGPARLAHGVLSALQALQRNTTNRARRHVAAHYDLGNALFETLLDREHWLYSSAIFPRPDASLEDASTYKLELILDKLDVGPEHHLLEIGTGWGDWHFTRRAHEAAASPPRPFPRSSTRIPRSAFAKPASRIASPYSSAIIATSRGVTTAWYRWK